MIDVLIDATMIFGAAYVLAALISKAARFTPVAQQSEDAADVEPATESKTEEPATENSDPSTNERWDILGVMTVTHLRKLAKPVGVQWRNAHGKHKHMSKDELITELVNRWALLPIDTQVERLG